MKNNLPVREILILLLICSLLTLNVHSAACPTPDTINKTPCPDCVTGNGYEASLTDSTICNLIIANCNKWSADG